MLVCLKCNKGLIQPCADGATAGLFGQVSYVKLDFIQAKYKTKLKEEPVVNILEIAQ